jgi:hypothetical protein
MRYELRLTAFDMLGEVHVSANCYVSSQHPARVNERVWARTVTIRGEGRSEATDWIREVLEATLAAL